MNVVMRHLEGRRAVSAWAGFGAAEQEGQRGMSGVAQYGECGGTARGASAHPRMYQLQNGRVSAKKPAKRQAFQMGRLGHLLRHWALCTARHSRAHHVRGGGVALWIGMRDRAMP